MYKSTHLVYNYIAVFHMTDIFLPYFRMMDANVYYVNVCKPDAIHLDQLAIDLYDKCILCTVQNKLKLYP